LFSLRQIKKLNIAILIFFLTFSSTFLFVNSFYGDIAFLKTKTNTATNTATTVANIAIVCVGYVVFLRVFVGWNECLSSTFL
jgi:hypothetical protein